MWWNILPSWVITGGLIYMPAVVTAGAAYVYMGSVTGREVGYYYHQYMIVRDKRILNGGDPFRQQKHLGLDGIPDD